MLSSCILDERISEAKEIRNQISCSLLKGHDTEEEILTSCSHPADKTLGHEGFIATQPANPWNLTTERIFSFQA